MKRITALALLFIAFIISCKNKDQFTIDGKLENAKNLRQVFLYRQDKVVDSAILSENSEFRFKVSSPDPDFFYISAGTDRNYLFVAGNGDELKFKADLGNQQGEYQVEGSEISEKLKEFNKISSKYGKVYTEIQNEYQQKLSSNPASKDSLESVLIPRFERNMDDFAKESIAFANENKDNLAGFYAISSLDISRYEPQMLKYAEEIKGKFPGNKPVNDFIARMEKIKTVAVGQMAPDFEAPSPDGSTLKLSDFKGKYVLLDFWASWCGPCRQENPNVVKQFNAFKDKGFTVLGVSLDESKENWVKAIKDDGLAWNHVSELNQWNSKIARQFQVEALPASFLLDPRGKILAKNLRGAELEAFLKKTLK